MQRVVAMLYLKRKYQRLNYYLSWRFPRLTKVIHQVSFPIQVFVLCAALYSFVDYYQQNYSFEASVRQHKMQQAQVAAYATRVAVNDNKHSSTISKKTDNADLRNRLLLAEQSLRAEISKAERALIEKQKEAQILQNKVLRARQLLKAEAQTLEQLKLLESQI